MHGAEMLVAITIFADVLRMIFGIVYLRNRENLAMIEKGMNPKDKLYRPAPFRSLKWGLLLLGAGYWDCLLPSFIDINLPYRIETSLEFTLPL